MAVLVGVAPKASVVLIFEVFAVCRVGQSGGVAFHLHDAFLAGFEAIERSNSDANLDVVFAHLINLFSIYRGFGVLGFWGFGVLGFWAVN